MSIKTAKQNRGETKQKFLGFFGTAPSQKTPRTRILSNFKLYTFLNFKLPIFFFLIISSFFLSSSTTYALRTISVSPTVSNINSGLVGYWTFDGKNLTNATATNSAGTSYDGALTNMTATSSIAIGKIGQALTFNGSNQYVNVGNNPLVGATKFTYSTWIKVSTSDFTGAFKTLVDDATGDANVNNGIVMGVDDRGGASPTAGVTAMFHTATGCTLVYSSNIFSSTSQWYHITLAYNGVSTPTLYVNGISKSYTTGVCSSGSGVYVPRSANMWLGAVNNGTFYFKGTMDDVRIYNRAISATEVQTLYKMGGGVSRAAPAGPVAYWKFDNNTLTSATATDSSPNRLDITLAGSPSVVAGKFGQALSFNGTSQYVNGGDLNSLDFGTGAFTASVWVKTNTSVRRTILSKFDYDGTSTVEKGYYLHVMASGVLRGGYETNGTNYRIRDSSAAVNDNRWHHVVMVRSSVSADTDMYIDGILSNGATINNGTPSDTSNSVSFQIGHDVDPDMAVFTTYFSGSIDDPRMYNRALSQSEITALYKNSQSALTYAASVPVTNPINTGLVGYWTFDGKNLTNATATDSSGNGNDGTRNGGSVIPGIVGQGLSLNGTSDYIVGKNIVNIPKVTISTWVYLTAYPATTALVGGFTNGLLNSTHDKEIYLDNSGKPFFYVYDGGAKTTSTSAISVPLNKWTHLVATADGSNVYMYLNGSLVGSVAAGNTYISYSVPNVFIGGASSYYTYLKQRIDDFRVYNRALSAKEILTLYKMGAR